MFLTKCLSSALIPLKPPWKISGCVPASFCFQHSITLVRDHYVILLFSLSFIYDFILSLIAKEVIEPKMIVMIFPEIDETTWTGKMQDTQWTHNIYASHIYIQFRLCVYVNVNRITIFHKCSECYRAQAPRFKNHAIVQKSCSSSISSISSAFHSNKVISKLSSTDSYEI